MQGDKSWRNKNSSKNNSRSKSNKKSSDNSSNSWGEWKKYVKIEGTHTREDKVNQKRIPTIIKVDNSTVKRNAGSNRQLNLRPQMSPINLTISRKRTTGTSRGPILQLQMSEEERYDLICSYLLSLIIISNYHTYNINRLNESTLINFSELTYQPAFSHIGENTTC